MGRIVTDGRARELKHVDPHAHQDPAKATQRLRIGVRMSNGKQRHLLNIGRKKDALQVEADLETVREHFGLNLSDAVRVSLHLSANAIRNNRAMPEIE